MSNKKISQLDNLAAGSQADTDLIEVARPSTAVNYKFTWANIKAALKTYFDTLYTAVATFTSHVSDFEEHSARHENAGDDEISVAGLSGELADDQPSKEHSNTKHSTNLVGETGVITAMTPKTTPADADVVVIEDSAASNVVKSLSWTNIKATLKTYFDAIYAAIGGANPSCSTMIPNPMGPKHSTGTFATEGFSDNEVINLGMIRLPFGITVNKITFSVEAVGTEGTMKILFYSEDGQTKEIDQTTASMSGTGMVTEILAAPVELDAGIHYIGVIPLGTANISLLVWSTQDLSGNFGDLTGKATLEGTLAITADTPPATFDPSTITYSNYYTLACRIDT